MHYKQINTMLMKSFFKAQFISLLFLCLFFIPKEAKAFWPFTDACFGVYMDPAGTSTLRLSTTSSNSTNSYAEPRIWINATGCAALVKITCNLSVGVNETKSCHDFGIHATMTMASVNNMFNAYHVGDAYDSTTNTANLGACAQNTDPLSQSVCNFYAQMFSRGLVDSTGQIQHGYFVAICAYITNSQQWWQSFTNLFTTTKSAVKSAMNGSWTASQSPSTPSGYTLIGCSPTVVAPFPPSYGIPTGPIYQISPTVQPICQDNNPPTFTIGTSRSSICLPPKDITAPPQNDNATYSSFNTACMRVTFPNPVRASQGSTFPNPTGSGPVNFYTMPISEGITPAPSSAIVTGGVYGVGANVQALYTWPSSNISTCDGQCTFTSEDFPLLTSYAQIYDSNAGTLTSPIFEGYNLADFTDLCYNFATSTGDSKTIIDIYNNTRSFSVVRSCDVAGTCDTNGFNPLYQETQICLKDNESGNYYNCVDRPSMTPPTVSFCQNQQNTLSNICMNVNIKDTGETCQITYTNGNITNNCTNSNIPLSAFLTDRCANNGNPSLVSFFAPYTSKSTTCNCVSSQNCPTNSAGLCYNNGNYQYGASKFCLMNFDVPMTQPQSYLPCNENCNAVCINSSIAANNLGLCSRINPPPSISTLTPDQYCLVTQNTCSGDNCVSTQQNTGSISAAARAKLPIENDLCTDVLLFDLVDCITITNPQYNAACTAFVSLCTTQLGNHYVNLDTCNNTYNSCLSNPGPQTPSNNCYYIKPNSQYTNTPKIPTKCPAGWTPQNACGSNTFYNKYFYTDGNSKDFKTLSTIAGANAVACLTGGGYSIYCCDGNFWGSTNDVCPTPSS